jgi:hypothetical protein
MPENKTHLSDEELLLFIDRELPARRQSLAGAHLAECTLCRARRTELEGTLAQVADLYQGSVSAPPTSGFASRALLKDRIADTVAERNRRWTSRIFLHPASRQFVCAGIALLIVAAGGFTLRTVAHMKAHRTETDGVAFVLPRKALTPGASQLVSFEQLCMRQDLNNDPPVDPQLQQAVFQEYGLSGSSQSAYALDYLIAPTLGGSVDIKNLWPQPHSSPWNAQVKDQLEDHLHQMVCDHKLPLAVAQQQISTDWIAAYKSYFGTEMPQADSATAKPVVIAALRVNK